MIARSGFPGRIPLCSSKIRIRGSHEGFRYRDSKRFIHSRQSLGTRQFVPVETCQTVPAGKGPTRSSTARCESRDLAAEHRTQGSSSLSARVSKGTASVRCT